MAIEAETPAQRLRDAARGMRGVGAAELVHILRNVTIGDAGCWLWASTNRGGYGRLTWEKKNVQAHRWLWERLNGPVPGDLQLDHLCRVRNCVNPDHLEPVTITENLQRGHRDRRTFWCDEHGMKTMGAGGKRHCTPCRTRLARERRASRKGSPDTPHGTLDGYSNWACRCDACCATMREVTARRAAEKRRALAVADAFLGVEHE